MCLPSRLVLLIVFHCYFYLLVISFFNLNVSFLICLVQLSLHVFASISLLSPVSACFASVSYHQSNNVYRFLC